jgi:undecaprenyl-diphosphatase
MNVLSALAWAPAYLLPGMAFGASLALAGQVAARLAALLALLVVLISLSLWITHRLFRLLQRRAEQMARWLLTWSSHHPRLNRLIGGVFDRYRSEAKGLAVAGGVLVASIWLFLGVLEDVLTGDPLVQVDLGLYRLMQGLRTPWGDWIMVGATELGDGVVLAAVMAIVLAWLFCRRNWRAALYWIVAAGSGQIAATALKLVLQRPRPSAIPFEPLSAYGFPSGHATMSTVVYGFLAVLITRDLVGPWRWLPYAAVVPLVGTIALSRLYLGVHWFSDAVSGVSLGVAMVTLLAVAYYRHTERRPLPRGLVAVVALALVGAGGWHVASRHAADLERFAPRVTVRHVGLESWWRSDWRALPVFRKDLEGELEQPLNVQYAGSLESIREKLGASGWKESPPLTATSAMRWLLPAPDLATLPVLPLLHDGRPDALAMVHPVSVSGSDGRTSPGHETATAHEQEQSVLRFWDSGVVIDPGGIPLWVGSVSVQRPRSLLFLTLPLSVGQYDAPLLLLEQTLSGMNQRLVRRPPGAEELEVQWSGDVLLIRADEMRDDTRSGPEPADDSGR